jgi:hypothetical protein
MFLNGNKAYRGKKGSRAGESTTPPTSEDVDAAVPGLLRLKIRCIGVRDR